MRNQKSGATGASRDFFQEVTNRIIEALEAGTAPWVACWSDRPGNFGIPVNANGRPYRGINRILLQMQQITMGYRSPCWYTRRMANDAGGRIKKGEKGTRVVLFRCVERKEDDPSVAGDDEKPRRYWIQRTYCTWNLDQLTGIDADSVPEIPTIPAEFSQERSDQLVEASGADVRYGGNDAFFAPGGDYIQLPLPAQFHSSEGFHSTRFHELVHWSGHENRLARKFGSPRGNPDYAREELVAEMGAAFLCEWAGIEPQLEHPEYIAHWLDVLKADSRAVITAATQAQKAFDFLLETAGLNAPDPNNKAA